MWNISTLKQANKQNTKNTNNNFTKEKKALGILFFFAGCV
jgi:hypothetical protein